MVAEKGQGPRGLGRTWLPCGPGPGLVLGGSEWVWESLLLSEAVPAPGTAGNPPRGGPVKTTTKDIHQPFWGDFEAKWKVSSWKKERAAVET